ncbi:hypothetical protein IFM89_002768 [Coptis chinensis]|uniref:Carboxypeptidase n=1 Tax=Coptis chinensis TaxID=261450 RepID=A0A835HVK9_9MAGN|nr:hypothetical protein IFM89_002768 [Coptis chinensis]
MDIGQGVGLFITAKPSSGHRPAEDNLRFILNWLEEFLKYKYSDLYLIGESYAGHYIPQLATLMLEHNKLPNIAPIKLKAIALGNPLLDLDISINAADYLWSHGAISDETLLLEKTVCNDSRYLREYYHDKLSQECNDIFNKVSDEIGLGIDRNDLLLPKCLSTMIEIFNFCRSLLYQEDNFDMNIIPVVTNLLKNDIPVMRYR